MGSGEVHQRREERRRQSRRHAALLLTHNHQLVGAGAAERGAHVFHPVVEDGLGEQVIVVDLQRIGAGTHAIRIECAGDGQGKRIGRTGLGRRHIRLRLQRPPLAERWLRPRRQQRGLVGITLLQPAPPRLLLQRVALRQRLPQIRIGAGFVDQIPQQERHVVEALHQRMHEAILHRQGGWIEIGVAGAECLGKKCEQVELHGEVITPRRHQHRLDRAQGRLAGRLVRVDQPVPGRPDASADHVQPAGADLLQVPVPHPHVGLAQVVAIDIARHVSGADHRQRLAVELEIVAVDGELRAAAQIRQVAHPEARAIRPHRRAVALQRGLDHMQARTFGRLFRQSNRPRWISLEAVVLRGAGVRMHADFERIASLDRGPARQLELELQCLALHEQRHPRTEGEAVVLPQRQRLQPLQQWGIGKGVAVRIAGQEDPAPAHETMLHMIDQQRRRRQLATIARAPGQRGQERILAAVVGRRVLGVHHHRKPDHRAPRLRPAERGQRRRHIRVRLELQRLRTGRGLPTLDEKLQRRRHAGLAQPPLVAVAISRPRERLAAQHDQVSAAIEVTQDGRPRRLGIRRAIRQHEQLRLRRAERRLELCRVHHACVGKSCRQRRGGHRRRIGRGKTGLLENHRSVSGQRGRHDASAKDDQPQESQEERHGTFPRKVGAGPIKSLQKVAALVQSPDGPTPTTFRRDHGR